jgi:hypothetical protein
MQMAPYLAGVQLLIYLISEAPTVLLDGKTDYIGWAVVQTKTQQMVIACLRMLTLTMELLMLQERYQQ